MAMASAFSVAWQFSQKRIIVFVFFITDQTQCPYGQNLA
jgi:hypothetical protein